MRTFLQIVIGGRETKGVKHTNADPEAVSLQIARDEQPLNVPRKLHRSPGIIMKRRRKVGTRRCKVRKTSTGHQIITITQDADGTQRLVETAVEKSALWKRGLGNGRHGPVDKVVLDLHEAVIVQIERDKISVRIGVPVRKENAIRVLDGREVYIENQLNRRSGIFGIKAFLPTVQFDSKAVLSPLMTRTELSAEKSTKI